MTTVRIVSLAPSAGYSHCHMHPTVFSRGFVLAKYRSASWWETKEGVKLGACVLIEEVLRDGFGKCCETSLRLVVRELFATAGVEVVVADRSSFWDIK